MPVQDDPAGPSQSGGAGRRSPAVAASASVASAAVALDAREGGASRDDGSGRLPIAQVTTGDAPAKVDGDKSQDDPMLGTVIAGRYRIETRLGEGGMGAVYRVEHTHMRKRLALKVLHREMTSQHEIVARFEREAMAAAHIEHPNVAGATDFGKLEDGSCYLVLEYVEGSSLRSQIDQGPLDPPRAINVTVQILAALKRAHELGIVHRDLKPENVLLVDKDGDPDFVKVLDFGIARVPIGAIGGEAGPSLTRAGMVYGTPEYMAPEQALGQEVDGRSDLYSVGVMLFEMLAGRRPYDNKDKVALLGQHVAGPIPSVRSRAPTQPITERLDAVVSKMLAKSPSDRYQDAAEAAEALFMVGVDPSRPPAPALSNASGSYPTGGMTAGADAAVDPASIRGASPFEVAATMPPPAAAQPAARLPPKMFAGLAAFAAVLLVLIVVLVVRKPADSGEGHDDKAHPVAAKGSNEAQPPTISEDSKAKVQAALGRVTAGEVLEGIADLEKIAAAFPDDPIVHTALAQAYSKGKRHVDALASVKKLLAEQPESTTDPALDPIFDAALATPAAVDVAFGLLTGPMGPQGGRVLYAIAYEGRGPQSLSKRAKESLADADVQKALPLAIKGALELRNAPPGCASRKTILEKYKDELDTTAVPLLKPLQRTTGCGGFFKRSDCWPCLREGNLLNKVLAGIEERAKKQ